MTKPLDCVGTTKGKISLSGELPRAARPRSNALWPINVITQRFLDVYFRTRRKLDSVIAVEISSSKDKIIILVSFKSKDEK
jgi:hypothetical protein